MKCPLLRVALIAAIGKDVDTLDDCLKEECAWWDGRHSQCVIFTSSEALYNLRNDVKDIKDKMPLQTFLPLVR